MGFGSDFKKAFRKVGKATKDVALGVKKEVAPVVNTLYKDGKSVVTSISKKSDRLIDGSTGKLRLHTKYSLCQDFLEALEMHFLILDLDLQELLLFTLSHKAEEREREVSVRLHKVLTHF